jgi:hypothetical protein
MLIRLHKQATTTPKVRAAIQASDEPGTVLAERFGDEEDQKTVRWGLLKKPHASGSLCMSMVERLRCRVGKSAGNGNFASPGRCGI